MAVHELTEEELVQMNKQMFKKMDREMKHLSKEELENEIIDFLSKKQVCSLATCGKDGVPRISVVNYLNEGLTLYIFSEGGKKFKNLKENNKVAIGIGNDYRKFDALRGVNIWGTAEVFTEEDREFAHAMKFFSPIFKKFEKEIGMSIEFPKGMLRIIRVTPTKMVYYYNKKGISNAHWEAK
jgi:nitroimidazol reductase NimA-like FMN-containing flavoprotein (pyridoxamine 5'-phosphate oxidase superfamily)